MTSHNDNPSQEIILVVDDNPTNLKLVSSLLEYENYRVYTAINAEAAEMIIKEQAPSLILMDIALPGMDGLTLTRKLKAESSTQRLKIVALTAFAMKGDKEKAIAAGCDDYITKPINSRSLIALVNSWLRKNG